MKTAHQYPVMNHTQTLVWYHIEQIAKDVAVSVNGAPSRPCNVEVVRNEDRYEIRPSKRNIPRADFNALYMLLWR